MDKTELWTFSIGSRKLIFNQLPADNKDEDKVYEVKDKEGTLILRIIEKPNLTTITPAGTSLRLIKEDVYILAGFLQHKDEQAKKSI
ncbi:MAG: hypothetical protein CMM74_08620 [Rhodospirillaceae bacterium]|nr:hypothetical protein [Rhodospirillaceae bacterium]